MDLDIVPILPDGSIDLDAYAQAFRSDTHFVVLTHASNLTGDVYDIASMGRIAHEHGALVIVDAAQTAGHLPVTLDGLNADVLCFTGHKGLMGPMGTGGLVLRPGVEIEPVFAGGTGMQSALHTQPADYPEHLEAGTVNAHGIAGLLEGLRYIQQRGLDDIHRHIDCLNQRFRAGVQGIPGVTVFGGAGPGAGPGAVPGVGTGGEDRTVTAGACGQCGITALNLEGISAAQLAGVLDSRYGICVRAGAHCAPLMHAAMGTQEAGAVRVSFSCMNTKDEADAAVQALQQIAEELAS